jgi:hypothetical protein
MTRIERWQYLSFRPCCVCVAGRRRLALLYPASPPLPVGGRPAARERVGYALLPRHDGRNRTMDHYVCLQFDDGTIHRSLRPLEDACETYERYQDADCRRREGIKTCWITKPDGEL